MSVPSCLCGDFEFYVTYNSVTTQVYPTNFLETALVDELERDQIFYRRKFSGSLIFGGQLLKTDFNYFWAIEQSSPCTKLTFEIYKDSVIYWTGYFSTSNGSWDLDNCTYTITPLPEDNYVELLDEGDLEYNIITSGLSEVTTTYADGVTTIAYTHNYLLYDVIEYLADLIIPGITLSSTFFEDATNPVTLLKNHYDYLTIAQKSDIKYPTATNPATVGMMSFNQAMQICRAMNLYWDYDGTTLRIEHVSFWPETDGLNVRNQKLTQGTNKYKYINEQLPKYETFKWMEAEAVDFIGAPIWYNSSCVNQDSESNTSEFALNVTTDIEFIQDCIADPEDKESLISNDGWVLLANRLDGADLYIYFGTGEMGGTHFNIDLAWSRLHAAFWKHGRQLMEGYMNNNLTDFYTSKKIREQDQFSIISCETFDPTEVITTELGDDYFGGAKGAVKTATIKPYGQIDLILRYGYDENENTGLTADKTLIITEEKTGATETTYTVTLCQAEVVDLTISIWLTCVDSNLDTCDTVPVDVVITAGNVTGTSAPITWCDPGAGATCIGIRHKDINPSLGWVGDFINDPDANC